VYTAGIKIPTPFGETQYFHRNLNPKKLVEIQFTRLGPNQTLSRMIKLYKLPSEPKSTSIRPMKAKDVGQVK